MQVRLLDLDGSLPAQPGLSRFQPWVLAARDWGPTLRLAVSLSRFRTFERAVADWIEARTAGPSVTLLGSGDFHHVTLAFLRRLRQPFHLLVLDNHPDWMRGIPFLHCGTWLYHAARLPAVERIFHLGGNVDFDNGWRHLAPWPHLCQRKIVVFPAERRYRAGRWPRVAHEPLRPAPDLPVEADRVAALLEPHRADLARCPLYISIDKDVLAAGEAPVNWDSGRLTLEEVLSIVSAFRAAAGARLLGADIVGDWSPVRLRGTFRRLLHWTEHPTLHVDPAEAQHVNERTNLALLQALGASRPAERKFSRGATWVGQETADCPADQMGLPC